MKFWYRFLVILALSIISSLFQYFIIFDGTNVLTILVLVIFPNLMFFYILLWIVEFLLKKNIFFKIILIALIGILFNYFGGGYYSANHPRTDENSKSDLICQDGFPLAYKSFGCDDVFIAGSEKSKLNAEFHEINYLNLILNNFLWMIISFLFWFVLEVSIKKINNSSDKAKKEIKT